MEAKHFFKISKAIMFILPFIAFNLSGAYAEDTPNKFAQRKYARMPVEEAGQHVKRIIENREIPPLFGHSWKLPPSDLYARGVKVNDNDYMVFAAVGGPMVEWRVPTGNLSEFLPKIEELQQPIMEDRGEKLKTLPFFLNGILFSTIDFEIINKAVFLHSGGGKWTKVEQVIKKGGYRWFLGAVGILLS